MNFIEALEKETNVSTTENGATGYKTTRSALVDFNFKVASYRDARKTSDLMLSFAKVWSENKELALKYLFYLRDVREGVGERETFRKCIKELANYGVLDARVFDWIAEYGRYDDLFVFFDTNLEKAMLSYVQTKLFDDVALTIKNKPCSLLAKWMPSINTSSKKTKKMAMKFIGAFHIDQKDYRKTLAKLREHIKVLEKTLCQGNWKEVDYSTVPSNANLKYNKAFFKHDKEGREAYLESLKKGETKINASVAFPHDIVHKYMNANAWNTQVGKYDEALEQMWKALPDYVQGQSNIMVVRDGSGSMTSKVGGTSISALDISSALAVYFSERSEGQFKNKFITFSSRPELVDLSKLTTLHAKLRELYTYDDCSNTDLQATFRLVLDIAVKNHLKQEDIPNLLIISDMEFDNATTCTSWGYYGKRSADMNKLFDVIAKEYAQAGYELPKLIFWNVNSRTETIPLTENKNGVVLVSGFSPAIAKMVLNGELDPYKALVKELMSKRYEQVTLNK